MNSNNQTVIPNYESFQIDLFNECNYIANESSLLVQESSNNTSLVDGLLFDIYDRWLHHRYRDSSFESDTLTEASSITASRRRASATYSTCSDHGRRYTETTLRTKSLFELRNLTDDLRRRGCVVSARLVRQLKRRDHRLVRLNKNCDVITAILQSQSQKRSVDTQLRFTVEPRPGFEAFEQWRDAMRAVARLPAGLPVEFRPKVWLSLAEHYFSTQRLNWEHIRRVAFNERPNPDDDKLGLQIVKDLHRTGCDRFCSDADQAVLKRVLLAYARSNKRVGYCQGFNVLAALILEVMSRDEEASLKVMLLLVDCVLPERYFAESLQALSVDLAVFRDLLMLHLPDLAQHLEMLAGRGVGCKSAPGGTYEPPLVNVFTMQWFLTLFATCLPLQTTLRVWDAVLLEGSEVLLRTALVLWGALSPGVRKARTADYFYALMGSQLASLADSELLSTEDLISQVYCMAPFPFPGLARLREHYTYNITPFSAASTVDVVEDIVKGSVDDHSKNGGGGSLSCFSGIWRPQQSSSGSVSYSANNSTSADISSLGPGAVTPATSAHHQVVSGCSAAEQERRNMNLATLQNQYRRLQQRQICASLLIGGASASTEISSGFSVGYTTSPVLNHLFLGQPKRHVTTSSIDPSPYAELERESKENKYDLSCNLVDTVKNSCGASLHDDVFSQHKETSAETNSACIEDEKDHASHMHKNNLTLLKMVTDNCHLDKNPDLVDVLRRNMEQKKGKELNSSLSILDVIPEAVLCESERTDVCLSEESKRNPSDSKSEASKESTDFKPFYLPDSTQLSRSVSKKGSMALAAFRNSSRGKSLDSEINNPFPPNPRLMSHHRQQFGSQFGLYGKTGTVAISSRGKHFRGLPLSNLHGCR